MPNRTAAEVPIKGTKHTVIPEMAPHCYSMHHQDLKITDCQGMKGGLETTSCQSSICLKKRQEDNDHLVSQKHTRDLYMPLNSHNSLQLPPYSLNTHPPNYMSLFFLITHCVQLVLLILSWVWDHSLDHGTPANNHTLKEEWFSLPQLVINC